MEILEKGEEGEEEVVGKREVPRLCRGGAEQTVLLLLPGEETEVEDGEVPRNVA